MSSGEHCASSSTDVPSRFTACWELHGGLLHVLLTGFLQLFRCTQRRSGSCWLFRAANRQPGNHTASAGQLVYNIECE